MKLTAYGKLVRQLRIEGEIRTKDMGDELGVTPAHLSATETGKKNPSESFVKQVITFFTKRGLDASGIADAAFESQKTFKIEPQDKDRELVAAFARKFPNMSEENKEEILKLLK